MARFCVSCGSQISDETNVCSKCGQPAYQAAGGGTVAAPSAGTAGLTDNIAGMLAYVTIIPAIVFLLLEPYNRNRFIRFHSFQCIFLCIVLVAIHIVLLAVPIIGWAISIFVNLGSLVLWIVLLLKAYQGQKFKLPVIGDLAEKQANTV
jgi:uncharacterized membrane protein